MSLPLFRRALPCALAFAHVATAAQEAPSAPPTALKPVVIQGPDSRNDRRDSTTARLVVTREELDRFGDATVADVLNRVAGVSVNGVPGRGGEIRLRGLGGGYTQILLNGEPTAPGFSLDSLSPNLIERIEITRTPTADQSAQAVAGSINIVLKRVVRLGQRELKLAATGQRGRAAGSADLQWSQRSGALASTLAATLRSQSSRVSSTIAQQASDGSGAAAWARAMAREDVFDAVNASVTPRLSWTPGERDSVVLDGFASYQDSRNHIHDLRRTEFGPPPLYGDNDQLQTVKTRALRAGLAWTRELADGARLEGKLGLNDNQQRIRNHRQSLLPGQHFDEPHVLGLERYVDSTPADRSFTLTARYRLPYRSGHVAVVGWDAERSRRADDRLQRDMVSLVEPADNLDQAYSARVQRLAFFGQDEWQLSPVWSTYAGLRWESLSTRSDGNDVSAVRHRASLWSPILQSRWKVPGTQGDQVRLGLSRTYKAAATRELIARRFRYYDNGPTSPDSEGNPQLRPERAWGVDAAYERHLDGGGLLSANVFARYIDDVILQQLFVDGEGRWVAHPVNGGKAGVHGIELEAKAGLRQLLADAHAPAVDLRANLARNWSRVHAVPGPDNRLSQQTPLSANLGADWRPAGTRLTVGGSLGVQGGGRIRLSAQEAAATSWRRTLDVYGVWQLDATTLLRLSGSNLLQQDQVGERRYADASGAITQATVTRTAALYRLAVEFKL